MKSLKEILLHSSNLAEQGKFNGITALSEEFTLKMKFCETDVLNSNLKTLIDLLEKCCKIQYHTQTTNVEALNNFIQEVCKILYAKKIAFEQIANILFDRQAKFAERSGKFDEGINALRSNIEHYKHEIESNYIFKITAYENLIRLYVQKKDRKLHFRIVEELASEFQNTQNEQAFYLSKWGDYYLYEDRDKAIENFLNARKLLQINSKTDEIILMQIFERTAIAYYMLEDYFIAECYFIKQFLLAKRLTGVQSITLMNLGNCCFLNFKKGVYFYKKAEAKEIANVGENSQMLVHIYKNLAGFYLNTESYKEIIELTNKMFNLIEKEDVHEIESTIKLLRGSALIHYGEYKDVTELLGEPIKEDHYYELLMFHYNTTLALAHAHLFQFDKAVRIINQCFEALYTNFSYKHIYYSNPDLFKIENKKGLYDTLNAKVELLFLWYKNEKQNVSVLYACILTIQQYLKTTEWVIDKLENKESKILECQDLRKTYAKQILIVCQFLQDLKNIDKDTFELARKEVLSYNQYCLNTNEFNLVNNIQDVKNILMELIEKDKAAVLLKSITESDFHKNLPPNIAGKEQYFKQKINKLLKEIQVNEATFFVQESKKNIEVDEYFDLICELRSEYLDVWENYQNFKKEKADYYIKNKFVNNEKYSFDYGNLQKKLTKDQAVLNYFIFENQLVVQCITDSFCEFTNVLLDEDFQQSVMSFNQAIGQFNNSDLINFGNKISKLLIFPMLKMLEDQAIKHLFIIPHEYLNNLSFECLFFKEADEDELFLFGGTLPFLIEAFSVSYHFSASVLEHFLSTNKKTNELENYIGFAPVYAKDKQQPTINLSNNEVDEDIALRSVRIGEKTYQALTYSEEEIKNVQLLFESHNKKTDVYFREAATIASFTKMAELYDIVHIAAHGYETAEGIDLSGIIFSPEIENSDHSIFYLQDAYNLDLNAKLVILSCCKSGIGKYEEGEGVMAVNRGFIQAGAANVLFTLFKIYDNSSSKFIQYFFKQIIKNKYSYSKALQVTKQYFLRSEKYCAPQHWAGFVLIGE